MNGTATIENRKLKIAGLTIVYFLLSLFAVPAKASFEDLGTGARAAALGGAYVALGDDTLSLIYNPAGLARLRQYEVASEYSQFLTGLSDGSQLSQYFLGVGVPLKSAGTVALGWKQFGLATLYTERTFSMGYGQWLTQDFAAGVAVKQLSHSFQAPGVIVDDNGNTTSGTPSLFTQNGTSKSALSMDLGFLYRLNYRHFFGLSVQDINAPNVALDSSDSDMVERTWRFGWAWQSTKSLALTTSLTATDCPCGGRDYAGSSGIEKWWKSPVSGDFALRGAFSAGMDQLRQVSSGFGYRMHSLEFDYAFVFNLSGITLGSTAGTHRLSVSYRLGQDSLPVTIRGIVQHQEQINILNIPSALREEEASYLLEDESASTLEPNGGKNEQSR